MRSVRIGPETPTNKIIWRLIHPLFKVLHNNPLQTETQWSTSLEQIIMQNLEKLIGKPSNIYAWELNIQNSICFTWLMFAFGHFLSAYGLVSKPGCRWLLSCVLFEALIRRGQICQRRFYPSLEPISFPMQSTEGILDYYAYKTTNARDLGHIEPNTIVCSSLVVTMLTLLA